jgi:hypothetical protein
LIERLLLAGLDHYFDGRYEQAVNVWTRVAFLERGHRRARAYIERARGAMAEQQRESDELLHRGLDAYRAGNLATARELLTSAIATGGSETALVFLQRLGAAEAGQAAASSAGAGDPAVGAQRRTSARIAIDEAPAASTNWVATILGCAVITAGILFAAQPVASWLGDLPVAPPVVSPRAVETLPIVRTAEIRLARARALHADGRLHDALGQLAAIDRGDLLRAEADALTAAIQTALLAAVPASQTAGEVVR